MLAAQSPPPNTPLHAHSGAQQYTSLKPVGDRVLVKVRQQVVLPGRLSRSRTLSLALSQVTEEATVSAGGIMLPRHAPVVHIGLVAQANAPTAQRRASRQLARWSLWAMARTQRRACVRRVCTSWR